MVCDLDCFENKISYDILVKENLERYIVKNAGPQ